MKLLLVLISLLIGSLLPLKAETYVTEQDVQIDRCACAWFILRFIDKDAEFKFFKNGEKASAGIGFDYFGADYFHKGPDCSFTSFIKKHPRKNTTDQKALQAINQMVNDVFAWRDGPKSQSSLLRIAIDEQRNLLKDDQKTLTACLAIFDYCFVEKGGSLPEISREEALQTLLKEQKIIFASNQFTEPNSKSRKALLEFLNLLKR